MERCKNTKLRSGDSVEFRELYNTAENIVTIQGNVKHPATYAYKEGMRLSDILKVKMNCWKKHLLIKLLSEELQVQTIKLKQFRYF